LFFSKSANRAVRRCNSGLLVIISSFFSLLNNFEPTLMVSIMVFQTKPNSFVYSASLSNSVISELIFFIGIALAVSLILSSFCDSERCFWLIIFFSLSKVLQSLTVKWYSNISIPVAFSMARFA